MKTDTGNKIFDYIKQQGTATPKEIISHINFSPPAIFRQLKKLINTGLIQKTGTPPKVFYHITMDTTNRLLQEVFTWVTSPTDTVANLHEKYCESRDIFQSRSEKILNPLIDKTRDEGLSYLLLALIEELGNNSFDHNFGNWPDIPGVYFYADIESKIILLADRGQGVFETLRNAKHTIQNEQDAVYIAFTEIISGRAPEKRGNGLKFVKKVIEDNDISLTFFTGNTQCNIKKDSFIISKSDKNFHGTISILSF